MDLADTLHKRSGRLRDLEAGRRDGRGCQVGGALVKVVGDLKGKREDSQLGSRAEDLRGERLEVDKAGWWSECVGGRAGEGWRALVRKIGCNG